MGNTQGSRVGDLTPVAAARQKIDIALNVDGVSDKVKTVIKRIANFFDAMSKNKPGTLCP